jgi:hypothetical protein
MRAGLQYIFFIFLVILAVSFSNSGNSYSHRDIQTCTSIHAAPVFSCILPDSQASLKKISGEEVYSLFVHKSYFEIVNSCRIKLPENTFIDQKTPLECIALGQRILFLLIFTNSPEDDHHTLNG